MILPDVDVVVNRDALPDKRVSFAKFARLAWLGQNIKVRIRLQNL